MSFLKRITFSFPLYFLLLLLLFSKTLAAQNFNIQTFTTKDGLSHNDVRAMALDSSGFLWIATWDGLNRYNGYSFKNYFHKTDDSFSLPYFSIYNVLVDGGNNLWLLTDDKVVVKYDRTNDNFRTVNQLYDSLPQHFSQISTDESGHLWLINQENLYRFDFRKNKFDKYELRDYSGNPGKVFSDNSSYSIFTSGNDKVWIVGARILEFEKSSGNKLDLKQEYFIDQSTFNTQYDFDFNYWFNLYSSSSGNKWIFSNTGLFLLNKNSLTFREFKGKTPVNEFTGRDYFCWSRKGEGIYVYEPAEARLLNIPESYSHLVKKILCQNKNLIWFSGNSINGSPFGLDRVVFTPGYFHNYLLPYEKNDIPAVYAIAEDPFSNIWVGKRGKDPLIKMTPEMKSAKTVIPKYETSIDPGAIRSLTVTPGGLWIGFFRELLLFYNFDSGTFTRHITKSANLRAIAINNEGDLYLAGENDSTIILYSPKFQKIEKRIPYSHKSPIYKFYIDKEGILWAGLNLSTILRYDPQSEKSETIIISQDNYNIEDICQGDNEVLWFALLGGGVCNYDPKTGKKKFYTTSDGLTNDMTYSILKDKSGNIWVSTNTGISRINPNTGMISSFGPNEGLNINEFNSGASYVTKDGEFLMGGMGGLVGFRPDSINLDETEIGVQKIIIDEIKVSGAIKHFTSSVSAPDTIILNKGENNVQITFSSSDFTNSGKTLYRYRLSRVNKEWIETDSRNRSINFSNLKPGWYDLNLQATDRSGSWSASKDVKVRIKPFYYQTLIFRIIVPLILILLIVDMLFLYIRQLNHRATQKQDALRLKSLQAQMNPHFIFNSLNSINYFISKNDALSANRYIADFSKLIRSILYNFNSDFISLEREIESLEEYLKIEHLRFGDKFNYRFYISPDIEFAKFMVSPGLVQPFIENAIWHGVRGLDKRKGNVEVSFVTDNRMLKCTIEDDGIGRKKAEALKSKNDQKVSKGIFIVTERLKIINNLQKSNYQVTISDLYSEKQETGTKVVIEIPVKKN